MWWRYVRTNTACQVLDYEGRASRRNDDGDDRISQQRRLPTERTALLDVSIAIVSWNDRDTLRVCPRSF